jgi:predicted ATP-binding protein involved in virulence
LFWFNKNKEKKEVKTKIKLKKLKNKKNIKDQSGWTDKYSKKLIKYFKVLLRP